MEITKPSELDILSQNATMATEILNGVIVESEENDKSIADLIEVEQKMRAELRRINEEIAKKRTRRAELKNTERLAKRESDAANVKLKQYTDQQSKEASKLDNFKVMSDHAHAKDFAWVSMALPHQWQGALQLAHYGSALLADTMGLGKTLQSLMYLDMLSCGHDELGAKRVVIICPDAMVTNFVNELRTFAPHRKNIVPLSGANNIGRSYAKMAMEFEEFTIVTNYNAIRNNDMTWLSEYELDAVIIDEAHNTSNVDGSTFESIRALKSKNYLPMTATFILNRPQDIFGALNLVMPNIFDEERKFLSTYCEQGYENKWRFKEGGEKALMHNLGGRIVKRNYSEAGVVLPEMVRNDVIIPMSDMTEEQFNVYQQITKYSEIAMPNGDGAAIESVIALITRQRQAACFPAGITVKVTETMYNRMTEMGIGCEPVGTVLLQIPETVPSIKIDIATERITKAVANGHRTVVFSQFKTALKGLEKSLKAKGLKVARYDGETNKKEAVKIKEDFKRKPDNSNYEYDVVLVNYKSGGVGLTFTAATYLLKLDEEWNPGKNDQAEARIHRIGQTEKVLVETLIIDNLKNDNGITIMGSIDLWMRELNEIKAKMIGGIDNAIYETNMADSYRKFLIQPVADKAIPAGNKEKPKPVVIDDDDFGL